MPKNNFYLQLRFLYGKGFHSIHSWGKPTVRCCFCWNSWFWDSGSMPCGTFSPAWGCCIMSCKDHGLIWEKREDAQSQPSHGFCLQWENLLKFTEIAGDCGNCTSNPSYPKAPAPHFVSDGGTNPGGAPSGICNSQKSWADGGAWRPSPKTAKLQLADFLSCSDATGTSSVTAELTNLLRAKHADAQAPKYFNKRDFDFFLFCFNQWELPEETQTAEQKACSKQQPGTFVFVPSGSRTHRAAHISALSSAPVFVLRNVLDGNVWWGIFLNRDIFLRCLQRDVPGLLPVIFQRREMRWNCLSQLCLPNVPNQSVSEVKLRAPLITALPQNILLIFTLNYDRLGNELWIWFINSSDANSPTKSWCSETKY